jgi:hypothetical protein
MGRDAGVRVLRALGLPAADQASGLASLDERRRLAHGCIWRLHEIPDRVWNVLWCTENSAYPRSLWSFKHEDGAVIAMMVEDGLLELVGAATNTFRVSATGRAYLMGTLTPGQRAAYVENAAYWERYRTWRDHRDWPRNDPP